MISINGIKTGELFLCYQYISDSEIISSEDSVVNTDQKIFVQINSGKSIKHPTFQGISHP